MQALKARYTCRNSGEEIVENILFEKRLKKTEALRQKGISPYSGGFKKSLSCCEAEQKFTEELQVSLAGRLMSVRAHGKSVFADIKDLTGRIQVYAKIDILGENEFETFKGLDIGDIIGVEGKLFKTRTGQVTVVIERFKILSKSLKVLPEKWHGLKDTEIRYRQRFLDIIMNNEVRCIFEKRSKIVSSIRQYLEKQGFIEVETPVLQSIPGGAIAKPFITHHNALGTDLYLRIAPELYLKRLLIAGFEKVFEIGKNFRNEGISTKHNPEFTMLEAYQAYSDYGDMMSLCEGIIKFASKNVLGAEEIEYEGKKIILSGQWKRLDFFDTLNCVAGEDLSKKKEQELREVAKKIRVDVSHTLTRAKILDELLKKCVGPTLIQPTFFVDYPVELSPFAKRKQDNPVLVERFQLFIGGLEVANAFSELNDPVDQKKRFEEQIQAKEKGDADAHFMDEDFINALEYGMPPAGGLGIGIDRLIMLLCGKNSIREVILFPQLKKQEI